MTIIKTTIFHGETLNDVLDELRDAVMQTVADREDTGIELHTFQVTSSAPGGCEAFAVFTRPKSLKISV